MLALKQSSRTTPVVPALLGELSWGPIVATRRPQPKDVLSPRRRGSKFENVKLGTGLRRCDGSDALPGSPLLPSSNGETAGSCRRGLSEWRAQSKPFAASIIRATSSAAAPLIRVAQSTPKGRQLWGRLSLPTFFGEAKKVGCRRATPGF